LTKEESAALEALVEAARSVPSVAREPFDAIATAIDPNWSVFHPGLPGRQLDIYPGDMNGLDRAGMFITRSKVGGRWQFDLSETALRFYDRLKVQRGAPLTRIQDPLRRYMNGDRFRKRHAEAHDKWVLAEGLLWKADSEAQYTAIGHHCREAMQAFGTSLLQAFPTPSAPSEITATKNRIEAVLRLHSPFTGRRAAFLDAVLGMWNATIDLAQRQEHGLAAGPATPLTWEDGRRLVQHTASAMYEIDSVLP
jgi:hypothetical protein